MSSVSPLNRAADVSVQLVMQCLDIREIPRFARCSRRLLRLADTDFVWSRCLVRVFDSRSFSPKQGLLRHAPLHVTWRSKSNPATQGDVASLLAIAQSHRVAELDASVCWELSSELWCQVLTHPSMQQLTLLAMHGVTTGRVTRPTFAALLALPHLSSLYCRPTVVPEEADLWSQLPLMPALTQLQIKDSAVAGLSRLPHIAQCPKLIDFSVINSDAIDGGIIAFCSAPLMAGLRRLKIDGLNKGHPISSEAWIPAFQCLRQLETLELRRVQFSSSVSAQMHHLRSLKLDRWNGTRVDLPIHLERVGLHRLPSLFALMQWLHEFHLKRLVGIDGLLPAIKFMVRLNRLIIEPAVRGEPSSSLAYPTASSLRTLLQSCPMLQVTLRLLPAALERHASDASCRVIASMRRELSERRTEQRLGGVLKIEEDCEPEP